MKEQRTPIGKFIHDTWTNINLRCGKYRRNTSKNKCYKNIFIEFSREEFKTWCLQNSSTILSLKRPSIDRIDSDKNYSLANIQVLELEDNVRKKRPGNNYLSGPGSKRIRGIRIIHKKWTARIRINGKEKYLGTFNNKKEAVEAFKNIYKEVYGKEPFNY